jgi:hypothetical protein
MRKKRPLLVVSIITVVLLGGTLALLLLSNAHENTSRQVLAAELGHLPVPAGCQEQSRDYQRGGVDTNSAWHVQYDCTGTSTAAYNEVLTSLRQRNYRMSWGSSGMFRCSNGKFEIDYSFYPKPSIAGAADSTDATPARVSLTVYRQGRSY